MACFERREFMAVHMTKKLKARALIDAALARHWPRARGGGGGANQARGRAVTNLTLPWQDDQLRRRRGPQGGRQMPYYVISTVRSGFNLFPIGEDQTAAPTTSRSATTQTVAEAKARAEQHYAVTAHRPLKALVRKWSPDFGRLNAPQR